MAFLRKNQLWLFFILTLVFAFSMAAVSLASQNEGISILIPLSPSIIGIIIAAVFSGRAGLRELFIGLSQRFPLRWLAVSLLVIPILACLAILVQSLFGGPAFSLLALNIGNLIGGSILVPLGEEFGWRGFALPKLLEKYSALTTSLILGVIWGGWHYAGHLVGAGVEGISFFYLFLWILGATILFTWIFNHTRNIWTMILLHSAANATFNLIPITPINTGGTATFYTFIGLVWLLALIVVLRFGPQTLAGKKAG
jgi:membrane protease YdiL (CAAX protease family)